MRRFESKYMSRKLATSTATGPRGKAAAKMVKNPYCITFSVYSGIVNVDFRDSLDDCSVDGSAQVNRNH